MSRADIPLNLSYLLLCAFIGTVVLGCSDGELRGRSEPSSDGRTYLVVEDDNGGHCGPVKINGIIWQSELNEPGLIPPGTHEISCGDDSGIFFEIQPGTTFYFDYWGP